MYRQKIWDLPIRFFHWTLVLLIIAAIVTGKIGGNAMIWHGRIGTLIVGLIAFRVVWGFCGSKTARFFCFFPTPQSILLYLRGRWEGIGHNPLGAFSVFGLLALIAAQAISGLFTDDDIAFKGALASLISSDLSQTLTALHRYLVNALIVLIGLHIAAILFYRFVKKERLVAPMVRGWKPQEKPVTLENSGGSKTGLFFAILFALLALYGASGLWIPAPPAPVAAPSAAW